MNSEGGAAHARPEWWAREDLPWLIANPLMAGLIGMVLAGWVGAIVALLAGVALVFLREIAGVIAALSQRAWAPLAPHAEAMQRSLLSRLRSRLNQHGAPP